MIHGLSFLSIPVSKFAHMWPDPNNRYVYKSAGNYIIKLRLHDTSNTNFDRTVFDRMNAKFRCDFADVVEIKHKVSGIAIPCIASDHNKKFIYTSGGTVEERNFNHNSQEICTKGIDFYLTEDMAFYDGLDPVETNYTGPHMYWNADGKKTMECSYIDGKLNGTYIEWYNDGEKSSECTYTNGRLHGTYMKWYNDGNICVECSYIDGYLDGPYIQWRDNGKKWKECTYTNGIKHGKFMDWYSTGQKDCEGSFVNGELSGRYQAWYENGKKHIECTFKNGKKHGGCVELFPDGQICRKCSFDNGEWSLRDRSIGITRQDIRWACYTTHEEDYGWKD